MTIGQRLSDLGPKERAKENELKVAVHQTATEIAQEYLNEISPYVGSVQLDRLWSMINGNIMTRAELQRAFGGYNQPEAHLANLAATRTSMCLPALQGRAARLRRPRPRQRQQDAALLMPGERTFDPDGILPTSSHYLVHPALGSLIAKVNTQFLVEHRQVRCGRRRPRVDRSRRGAPVVRVAGGHQGLRRAHGRSGRRSRRARAVTQSDREARADLSWRKWRTGTR